jgi:hypothetical protein
MPTMDYHVVVAVKQLSPGAIDFPNVASLHARCEKL